MSIWVTNCEELADLLTEKGLTVTYWPYPWVRIAQDKELQEYKGKIYILISQEELRIGLSIIKSLPKSVTLVVPSPQKPQVSRKFVVLGPVSPAAGELAVVSALFEVPLWLISVAIPSILNFLRQEFRPQ